jgi:erythritol transport system ATP-binding protein
MEVNMDNSEIILSARNITKVYPGTKALDSVDFDVYRGQVNVLIGENGAGKSTLMKILAGAEQASDGELIFEGRPIRHGSTIESEKDGIVIIYQELNLFPNLSIAENIFIGREQLHGGFHIDHAAQDTEAAKLLARLQHDLNPKTLVEELRIGEQQIVEIAKALSRDAKILIMDEPTSALSDAETEVLFRIIKELKEAGVSIVYISHRLEELLRIGDRLTVLRDGKLQASAPRSEVDLPWIIRHMTGEANIQAGSDKERTIGEPFFELRDICLPRVGGGLMVDNVSLTLRRGEILGLFGLIGAGRSELFECIMAARPEATGDVLIDGKKLTSKDITGRIADGIALIPEDRQREGLVQNLSVTSNMTLSSLGRFMKGVHISENAEKLEVEEQIRELSIKVSSPNAIIGSLSGGNQQKVVIGKGLLAKPKLLLMDEPTRGIDVSAKADVFRIVRKLAAQGLGVILVTSELKEILAISDRIVVLSKGRVTGTFDRAEATEEKLVAASAALV